MGTKLEQVAIVQRTNLTNPNYYNLDWKINNTTNTYSLTHTRALSDSKTPVNGKGTGIFLDTINGGGSLDINGNPANGGLGRLSSIQLNTANWSYGPNTPYSVTNTRALSDNNTPVYGKGTGVFLDPDNGGGSLDINGNPINGGLGRLGSILLNSFTKSVPYDVKHTRAISDTTTPENGKGNLNSTLLTPTNDYTLEAHFDINGGSKTDKLGGGIAPNESGRNNLLSVKQNIYFPDLTSITNFKSDTTKDVYNKVHPNALADLFISPDKGKGNNNGTSLNDSNNFVLPAHHDINGGNLTDRGDNPLKSDSGRKNLLSPNNNTYFPDLTSIFTFKSDTTKDVYNINHPNALSGNEKGKGTNDKTLLDKGNDFVLPAHTNYTGGSSTDISQRALLTVLSKDNIYNYSNNIYTVFNPNALAGNDEKGKGNKNGTSLDKTNDFTLEAHHDINGGNLTDRGENTSKTDSGRKNLLNVKNNIYFPDLTNNISFKDDKTTDVYSITHPNALSGNDEKGKGDSSNNSNYLNDTENYKTIGSVDDIKSRNNTNSGILTNLYKPDITQNNPINETNWYTVFNPNALAGNDEKGKGNKNNIILTTTNDFTLEAHHDINGGNLTDRGENTSKTDSGRKNLLNVKNNRYYPSLNTPIEYLDDSKGNWYKKPDVNAQTGSFTI